MHLQILTLDVPTNSMPPRTSPGISCNPVLLTESFSPRLEIHTKAFVLSFSLRSHQVSRKGNLSCHESIWALSGLVHLLLSASEQRSWRHWFRKQRSGPGRKKRKDKEQGKQGRGQDSTFSCWAGGMTASRAVKQRGRSYRKTSQNFCHCCSLTLESSSPRFLWPAPWHLCL